MRIGLVTGALLVSLAGTFGGADALWAKMTEAELISQSEVIVTGELIGQTRAQLSPLQPAVTLGVLRVEEVLKGDAGQNVVLLTLPSPEAPRSSTDLAYRRGQNGLWFLRLRAPGQAGIYAADHPQRFVPAGQAGPQVEAVRKSLKGQGATR